MRPALRGWVLVATAVVVSVGATTYAAIARPSQPVLPVAQTVPISASLRVCPTTPPPSVPGTTTVLSAAALPATALPVVTGAAAPGDGLSLTPARGKVAWAAVSDPGGQATYPVTSTKGIGRPTILRAQGNLAPGATATQVTYVPTGAHRSLVGGACPAPTGDAWFVGGSGISGRFTRVELDNPDATPAVADVLVYGEHGQVPAPAGRGISVPASGSATLNVYELAPGTALAALHVVLREGRAAVTVTDEQYSGLRPRGGDVIPATTFPAKRVVIPGVPQGQVGSRAVQILAPGDQDALVQVQVIGRNGRFTPDNLAALDVPAGTVVQAQVLAQVGDASVGLVITSDQPIVAAVRNVVRTGTAPPDVSYSVGAPSLRIPVLAAGLRTSSGWSTRLAVTAPSTDGSVDVVLLHPDGTQSTATVQVAGGTTDEVLLNGPDTFTAMVTPGATGGPVYVAVTLISHDPTGFMQTSWPLLGSARQVTLPPARTDPALGVPGH